ncbi:MAG: hypothetical protein ABSB71_07785 [Candidatus Bathyarchaeia archaeon]|jgi:hypothetical protein
MSEVQVNISGKQLPTDYFVVRVQLVHVKKGFFGLTDTQLAGNAAIATTRKESAELFEKFSTLMKEYGIQFTSIEEIKEKFGKA